MIKSILIIEQKFNLINSYKTCSVKLSFYFLFFFFTLMFLFELQDQLFNYYSVSQKSIIAMSINISYLFVISRTFQGHGADVRYNHRQNIVAIYVIFASFCLNNSIQLNSITSSVPFGYISWRNKYLYRLM